MRLLLHYFDFLRVLHPPTQLPLLLMGIVHVLASVLSIVSCFLNFDVYISIVVCSSGASWMDFELVPFHHTWLVVQVLRCYVLHGLAASPSELFSPGGGEDARANGRAELAACGHASTCNWDVGEPAVTVLEGA